MRFPIRYAAPWTWLLTACLLPQRLAYIKIDDDTVKVRMAWAFRASFPRADVVEVAKYRPVLSIGVHGWRGRWLVNGANRPIAVIRLAVPARARVMGFPVALREILVSTDNRDVLREVLVK
jgi:hypothetical protein